MGPDMVEVIATGVAECIGLAGARVVGDSTTWQYLRGEMLLGG